MDEAEIAFLPEAGQSAENSLNNSLCLPARNETLEKFITLCRSRLADSPNRRKKRYSCLRKHVARYIQSRHWNPATFDCLIDRFSNLMLTVTSPDDSAFNNIFANLIEELNLLTGRTCSGKCSRKKRKKAKKDEPTIAKLEKSLAVVQRRIDRIKSEPSSSNAWEARDGRCLKLHGLQKKALRLTKKINDINNLTGNNTNGNNHQLSNLIRSKSEGDIEDNDLSELNCLLKSVRIKESVKLKPKSGILRLNGGRFGCCKFAKTTNYPQYEMVEIKKYDQHAQRFVKPGNESQPITISLKKMPVKLSNKPQSLLSLPSSSSSPSSSSADISGSPHRDIKLKTPNIKLDALKADRNRLRKQSALDLVCDRFRHVTLNAS